MKNREIQSPLGYVVLLSGPHPIFATICMTLIGVLVGGYGLPYGAGNWSFNVAWGVVGGIVVGLFGGTMSWAAHHQWLRKQAGANR